MKASTRAAELPKVSLPGRILQRQCSCGQHTGGGECAECRKKKGLLQRSGKGEPANRSEVPEIVGEVLQQSGKSLDPDVRGSMERFFGTDFSRVRLHTDSQAALAAESVDARAFAVGRHIVFGASSYAPETTAGKRLLTHELTHVIQQRGQAGTAPLSIGSDSDSLERQAEEISRRAEGTSSAGREADIATSPREAGLQRTPASKVSCAPGPLNVPGAPPLVVADPVGTITAAETRAQEILTASTGALESTRDAILAGAPVGWPTVGDSLGQAMRLMGLDPDNERVWRGSGVGTAALLLRRLRAVQSTIGAGSFFFTCLGPARGRIGSCEGEICTNAFAASCGGSFRVNFCPPFWRRTPEGQAETLMHESFHNFADFIQHNQRSREGNAFCYVRFAQTAAGATGPQRTDGCPDP